MNNSYEGIVVNSLFESSRDAYRENNSRYIAIDADICRVPAEEKKISSISTKELYACMRV